MYHGNNIRKRTRVVCSLKNRSLINHFLHDNTHAMHRIENIKRRFNTSQSRLLYSKTSPNITKHYIDHQINTSIIQFYHDNTQQSPSPRHQVFIYDRDGNKRRHPKHYLYGNLIDFYQNWCNSDNTQSLLHRLQRQLPSLSHFRRLRPKYVKFAAQCEYNLCTYHDNFKSMYNCWLKAIHVYCKCNTTACPNHPNYNLNNGNHNPINHDVVNVDNDNINDNENDNIDQNNNVDVVCTCGDCSACPIYCNDIANDCNHIITDTLCPFNESPKLSCLFGNCQTKIIRRRGRRAFCPPCGFKKLSKYQRDCETFTVDVDTPLVYDQWESITFET